MNWVTKAQDLWFMTSGKGGVISDIGIYDTGTTFLEQNIRSYGLMYRGNCIEYLKLELSLG